MPALLTITSGKLSLIECQNLSILALLDISISKVVCSRALCSQRPIVSAKPSVSVSRSCKTAPASANLIAVALPIPEAAPVIKTVLPLNETASFVDNIAFFISP